MQFQVPKLFLSSGLMFGCWMVAAAPIHHALPDSPVSFKLACNLTR